MGVCIFRTYPSLINSDQAIHTTSEVKGLSFERTRLGTLPWTSFNRVIIAAYSVKGSEHFSAGLWQRLHTTDEVSGQTSHDHHADRQGAPMTQSDEMILGALHFDLYELTLPAEHLPSHERDSGSPAHHGVTTLRVRRRPAE